ncbi:MAG: D-aminoacyl-tRNA deacylase [Anaerolineae bacterium]
MRALIQRVTRGAVRVANETTGEIARGLVILVGVTATDGAPDVEYLANKIANLRIFEDDAGKFNLSALDTHAEMLVVAQFTLYADTRRGRRPDFIAAARPEQAEPLIEAFAGQLEKLGLRVARGRFRAHMQVEIYNDGPVTIWMDSKDR